MPAASCGLPTSMGASHSCASLPRSRLLFGLAPGGGYPAGTVARAAGRLLPYLFSLTPGQPGAYCSLWPSSAGSLRLGVTQHRALWSSDFPRTARSRPRLPGLLGQAYLSTRLEGRQGNRDFVRRRSLRSVLERYAGARPRPDLEAVTQLDCGYLRAALRAARRSRNPESCSSALARQSEWGTTARNCSRSSIA